MTETFTNEKPTFREYVHKLQGQGMGFDVLTGGRNANDATVLERVVYALAKARRRNDVGAWIFAAAHMGSAIPESAIRETVMQLCMVLQIQCSKVANAHADTLPMIARSAILTVTTDTVADATENAEIDFLHGCACSALRQAMADFEWRAERVFWARDVV